MNRILIIQWNKNSKSKEQVLPPEKLEASETTAFLLLAYCRWYYTVLVVILCPQCFPLLCFFNVLWLLKAVCLLHWFIPSCTWAETHTVYIVHSLAHNIHPYISQFSTSLARLYRPWNRNDFQALSSQTVLVCIRMLSSSFWHAGCMIGAV